MPETEQKHKVKKRVTTKYTLNSLQSNIKNYTNINSLSPYGIPINFNCILFADNLTEYKNIRDVGVTWGTFTNDGGIPSYAIQYFSNEEMEFAEEELYYERWWWYLNLIILPQLFQKNKDNKVWYFLINNSGVANFFWTPLNSEEAISGRQFSYFLKNFGEDNVYKAIEFGETDLISPSAKMEAEETIPNLTKEEKKLLISECSKKDVPLSLALAVIRKESLFNKNARGSLIPKSWKKVKDKIDKKYEKYYRAYGLFQIIPSNFPEPDFTKPGEIKGEGPENWIKYFEPTNNIPLGIKILSDFIVKKKDLREALYAYSGITSESKKEDSLNNLFSSGKGHSGKLLNWREFVRKNNATLIAMGYLGSKFEDEWYNDHGFKEALEEVRGARRSNRYQIYYKYLPQFLPNKKELSFKDNFGEVISLNAFIENFISIFEASEIKLFDDDHIRKFILSLYRKAGETEIKEKISFLKSKLNLKVPPAGELAITAHFKNIISKLCNENLRKDRQVVTEIVASFTRKKYRDPISSDPSREDLKKFLTIAPPPKEYIPASLFDEKGSPVGDSEIEAMFEFRRSYFEEKQNIDPQILNSALPYIHVDIVNPTEWLATPSSDEFERTFMSYGQTQAPIFESVESGRYGDRPIAAFKQLTVRRESTQTGLTEISSITLLFSILNSDALIDNSFLLTLMTAGSIFRATYGWSIQEQLGDLNSIICIVNNIEAETDEKGLINITINATGFLAHLRSSMLISPCSNDSILREYLKKISDDLEKAKTNKDERQTLNEDGRTTSSEGSENLSGLTKAQNEISTTKAKSEALRYAQNQYWINFLKKQIGRSPSKSFIKFGDFITEVVEGTFGKKTKVRFGMFNRNAGHAFNRHLNRAYIPIKAITNLLIEVEKKGKEKGMINFADAIDVAMETAFSVDLIYLLDLGSDEVNDLKFLDKIYSNGTYRKKYSDFFKEFYKKNAIVPADARYVVQEEKDGTMIFTFFDQNRRLQMLISESEKIAKTVNGKNNERVATEFLAEDILASQVSQDQKKSLLDIPVLWMGRESSLIKRITIKTERASEIADIVAGHTLQRVMKGQPGTETTTSGIFEETLLNILYRTGNLELFGETAIKPFDFFYIATNMPFWNDFYFATAVTHELTKTNFNTSVDFLAASIANISTIKK